MNSNEAKTTVDSLCKIAHVIPTDLDLVLSIDGRRLHVSRAQHDSIKVRDRSTMDTIRRGDLLTLLRRAETVRVTTEAYRK